MELRIAFFHGLESLPVSDKTEFLHENFSSVYAPAINYRNPEAFSEILNHLKENPVDLLMGSSMGGWFAYNLSSILGIPTLLFNPALHSRSFEPTILSGDNKVHHTIVLGISDDIVKPSLTRDYLSNCKDHADVYMVEIGHRTPINVFEKYVNKVVNNF